MCTVHSGSVKPRQSHKTVWCTRFFISMTFISIYRHRFGDFWSIYEALWWALQNTIMLSNFLGSMNFSILTMIFSVKYCKTFFLLIRQKSSKINGAHLRRGDLLYYSLCHNNNTFRVWSSLFCKHTPSKIFARCFCQNFSKVFLPASPFIPTSSLINFGDFCQPPRL